MTEVSSDERKRLFQGLAMGVAAAAFFSVTFVVNRQMSEAQGHWMWTASLRFLLMLPLLAGVLTIRGKWAALGKVWRASPLGWVLWGTLGCGVFYAALVAAASFSPAWMVAGTWPVAIVIGILLAPWMYRDHRRYIPRRALGVSVLIVIGVILVQSSEAKPGNAGVLLAGLSLVLLSATAHPIGNRMSMLLMEKKKLPTESLVRFSALVLGSLPLWLILAVWGWCDAGWPPQAQVTSVGIVALCGMVATPLFYAASDRVSRYPSALAAVEATQACEIVFTLLFEAMLIGIAPPEAFAIVGLGVIVLGIILHAFPNRRRHPEC